MEFIYLITGFALGFALSWFIAKTRFYNTNKKSDEDEKSIPKAIYDELKQEDTKKSNLIIELNRQNSEYKERSKTMEERLGEHKNEIEALQNQMKLEFKDLSNKILEEKSKKFLELNEKKVFDILNPLKERIQTFEQKVEQTYKEDMRERVSLKKELEQIVKLNQQVSEDALKLTNALKGDSKAQGNWGETQLELILNHAGLEKDIHYQRQAVFKNEHGERQLPDFVINLPDDKNIIVDSKVSLTAYEKYYNSQNENEKTVFLKQHIISLEKHIDGLSKKTYETLYDINTPDYVMLFVPLEAALMLALKEKPQLFEKALEKNIVIVSTSTLLATLRIISYIWKQENQKQNVVEIANEAGSLYDKFCNFLENDMVGLGKKLDDAKKEYGNAMNKLFESPKKGDTVIGRIERIKKLGANTTKSLSTSILKKANID